MLFTEDALWESPGLGRFEGRIQLADMLAEMSALPSTGRAAKSRSASAATRTKPRKSPVAYQISC
jgi:hypothetical protein